MVVQSQGYQPPSPSKPSILLPSWLRLFVCIVGIYGCFLTWGILQERISTIKYVSVLKGETITAKFRFFLVLNGLQALIASSVAYTALCLQGRQHELHFRDVLKNHSLSWAYLRLSACACIASPFGYAALQHITYPTMILGKSCKLLPVMLVSVLLYGKRYPLSKYLAVGLITFGVSVFALFEKDSGKASHKGTQSDSLFGIFLLLINLFIDGSINTWQDDLFKRYRVRSQHVMFFMNLISATLLFSFLAVTAVAVPESSELLRFIPFIRTHPKATLDMLSFGLLGSLGQLFIFHTIEHFGSVVLVTITVTRKLMTMLVSLVWFGHHVRPEQMLGMGAVGVALVMETFGKSHKSHHK